MIETLQTLLGMLRALVERVERQTIVGWTFSPEELETLMRVYRKRCSRFPCRGCTPAQHRACALWLAQSRPRRIPRGADRRTLPQLWSRVLANLEAGYGS